MQIQTDMEQQQKSVFTGCEQPTLVVAHVDRVGVAFGSFNEDTVTEYQYSVHVSMVNKSPIN